LVAPFKLIYYSIEVSDVLVLTVDCKLINFVFQIFPSFIPVMSADFTFYIVQVSPFISFGSCKDFRRTAYRLLVGMPEGKRPLGRPRRMWIDNIKMNLLVVGLNVVDWIGFAQNRYRWRALVNSVLNLRVP
jgi:hypothetical protein